MDKLEVGDIVGYEEEIGIVICLSPSPAPHHNRKLTASVKWMDGDHQPINKSDNAPNGGFPSLKISWFEYLLGDFQASMPRESLGDNMQVGDLVRPILHCGALGIIIDTSSTLPEVQIRWLTNSWGEGWMLTQNIETVDE